MCIIFNINLNGYNFRLVPSTNNNDKTVQSTPSKLQTKESPTISAETDKPIGN